MTRIAEALRPLTADRSERGSSLALGRAICAPNSISHGKEGPIRVATAEAMSSAFARDIPTILESDPETAHFVALSLREEVLLILFSQPD